MLALSFAQLTHLGLLLLEIALGFKAEERGGEGAEEDGWWEGEPEEVVEEDEAEEEGGGEGGEEEGGGQEAEEEEEEALSRKYSPPSRGGCAPAPLLNYNKSFREGAPLRRSEDK